MAVAWLVHGAAASFLLVNEALNIGPLYAPACPRAPCAEALELSTP